MENKLSKEDIKLLKTTLIRKVWVNKASKQMLVTIPTNNVLGIKEGDEVIIQKL
jgi:hypothetical protein